ncbi:Protein of unknown function, partial [Gryllus bimaculatus]
YDVKKHLQVPKSFLQSTGLRLNHARSYTAKLPDSHFETTKPLQALQTPTITEELNPQRRHSGYCATTGYAPRQRTLERFLRSTALGRALRTVGARRPITLHPFTARDAATEIPHLGILGRFSFISRRAARRGAALRPRGEGGVPGCGRQLRIVHSHKERTCGQARTHGKPPFKGLYQSYARTRSVRYGRSGRTGRT